MVRGQVGAEWCMGRWVLSGVEIRNCIVTNIGSENLRF